MGLVELLKYILFETYYEIVGLILFIIWGIMALSRLVTSTSNYDNDKHDYYYYYSLAMYVYIAVTVVSIALISLFKKN